ncbi:hypothetical protein [Massilia litorea]|jgi:hypothetical protein|uniref:DUF3147 family protein n=1 Tax=Massilia litorea TaxID=2769491 RepID=A0A7L9TZM7_9BURK|nr:hypothetical protein [Massilia litorea]QOL48067.1 hypothetical protein LPB04_13705 [Massilia litorea]
MNVVLLLKLLLVPCLIYGVTLAGRRWGQAVAGWLSAFPIVAGPILFTLTLEQGAGFAANAAQGTLLAVVAILVFSLAYAWAALRFGVAGSMALALLAYAAAVAALQRLDLPLAVAFVLVWAALLLARRLFPQDAAGPAGTPARGDLPWRMFAAAALVLAVTTGAAHLGARLSGFFAMFPVMSTVLVGFAHAGSGRGSAVALLRGMVVGYFGFAVFCVTLAMQLREGAVGAAFALALGCALVVHLVARRMLAPPLTAGLAKTS